MTRYVLLKQDRDEIKSTLTEDEKDQDSSDTEEYEMLVGNSFDTAGARDRWIDSVERILENESFERKEKHLRRNFREVRESGSYGLNEYPRWMM